MRGAGDVKYSPHVYLEYERGGVTCHDVEMCIRILVRRHPMLRATVSSEGHVQVLRVNDVLCVPCVTEAQGDPLKIRKEMSVSGPSTESWPLFDIRLTPNIVHISISLYIVDGATERIFREEVNSILSGGKLTKPPAVSYRDYVLWYRQHEMLGHTAKEYWRSRVTSLPGAPAVPTSAPEEAVIEGGVIHLAGKMLAPKWNSFKTICRNLKLTPTVALCCV